ncbi:glycosyltransferase family 4 protein [Chryseobacterium lacus]|uniref:glycosyltransferase family 4 protein n=1 Tax=Chryseobacterium lacus TaxID=2058346 RepID=UPI000F87F379|nr:glycosyltransferase family 4 protein [Chryseobacterium lacus]RST26688.1 glycosyltransferase [Chryseobacterium lacus]
MEYKIKVLMLVNYIPHYRLPVMIKLAEKFDLTVAHYADQLLVNSDINFRQVLLKPRFFGGVKWFKENVYKLSSQYDVVISLGEIRVLPNMLLGFRRRKFGLIFWGIGVGASYSKGFDAASKADILRFWLMRKADALLFYSDYPVQKYIAKGFDREKLFVAHNTVLVQDRIKIPEDKKHFIFVGTLYKQKKIYELLASYELYVRTSANILPLIIVGDGEEKNLVRAWIAEKGFENKIILKGQINDQNVIKELYQDAVACISPGQAGLTVLNSMAYGVPFVTRENAITGGEIFNVIHEETGVLYDGEVESLVNIMKKISEDSAYTRQLSRNAQDFYFAKRTVDIMVRGFEDAIHYASKKQYDNGI